jgi:hypothetical protein
MAHHPMTTTSTLTVTDFVLARIAEDEAAASVASPAPWHAQGAAEVMLPTPWKLRPWRRNALAECNNLSLDENRANAAHIARHDPARVLAQCAAMRKVVEDHRPFRLAQTVCQTCEEKPRIGYEAGSDGWPCPTIRALASIWSDHPQFDPAWA